MNTKELMSFLRVCQYGNITRAAKSLFITPQGLSKIIKGLENELNVSLLYRTPNGVIPTEYGEVLKKQAQHIIDEIQAIELQIQNIENNRCGTIHIASAYGVLSAFSLDWIYEFEKTYHNIKLDVMEYTDKKVEEAVRNGTVEAGFTIGPIDAAHFNGTLLKSYKMQLLVHKSNPLSRKNAIDFYELSGEKIIIEGKEFNVYDNFLKNCREAGFEPNIIFETTEISLAHKLCHQGKGIAVTIDFVAEDIVFDDVVAIPFADEKFTWDIHMITKRNQLEIDTVKVVEQFIYTWVKE